eukprot:3788947-Heterocapsa_arctica.AAC.1
MPAGLLLPARKGHSHPCPRSGLPPAVSAVDDDSTVSYEDAVEDIHSSITPAPLAELGSLVGAPPSLNPTPAGSPDLQL